MITRPNRVLSCLFKTTCRETGQYNLPEGMMPERGKFRSFADQHEYEYLLFHSPMEILAGEPVLLRFAPHAQASPVRVWLEAGNVLRLYVPPPRK